MDVICQTPGQDVKMLSMEGCKLSYPYIILPEGRAANNCPSSAIGRPKFAHVRRNPKCDRT